MQDEHFSAFVCLFTLSLSTVWCPGVVHMACLFVCLFSSVRKFINAGNQVVCLFGRVVPGVFGTQLHYCTDVIKQMLVRALQNNVSEVCLSFPPAADPLQI